MGRAGNGFEPSQSDRPKLSHTRRRRVPSFQPSKLSESGRERVEGTTVQTRNQRESGPAWWHGWNYSKRERELAKSLLFPPPLSRSEERRVGKGGFGSVRVGWGGTRFTQMNTGE